MLNSVYLMLVAMLLPGVFSKYQLMRDYTWTYQYTLIMNVDKRPVKKSEKRLISTQIMCGNSGCRRIAFKDSSIALSWKETGPIDTLKWSIKGDTLTLFTHSDHIEFMRKNTYEKFIVRVNKEKQKGELVSSKCSNISYHFALEPTDVQTQGK